MHKYWLLCLTLVLGCAVSQESKEPLPVRHIAVTGIGDVTSVPDQFNFNVYLEEKGQVAGKLNQSIQAKTKLVINALRKLGIDKKQIQSLNVQFSPWMEYNGQRSEQKGFILSRQLKIKTQYLKIYDKAIDAVLKIGINRIDGFNFTDSQSTKNKQLATEDALKNARQKAKDMAAVLGLKLGQVISISEAGRQSPQPRFRMALSEADQSSYLPGEMNTRAQVNVVFELVD